MPPRRRRGIEIANRQRYRGDPPLVQHLLPAADFAEEGSALYNCDSSDLGAGRRNMTSIACSELSPCDTSVFATNMCVDPVAYMPGDPVRTAPLVVTDYCEAVDVVPEYLCA